MKIIALDIATSTGACFDGPEGRPVFVTHRVPDLCLGLKLKSFAAWLYELIGVIEPDLLAIEAPLVQRGGNFKSNIDTARLLNNLAGTAHYVAACAGVPVTEKNVGTIKLHFAGSGRADKRAMMERCRQLRWTVRNDHEADAAGLWCLVKSERQPLWAPTATPLFAAVSA